MMKELETSKAQTLALSEERRALTAQLQALVGKIDAKLADPSKLSSAAVAKLTSLKAAAAASASAAAPAPAAVPPPTAPASAAAAPVATPAAARAATSYPSPMAKRGAKKGKAFFPLPYPDFSLGECYAY